LKQTILTRIGLLLASPILPGVLAAAGQQPTPSFRVTQSIELGAPDRWDYVVYDESTHDVFVSHGDRVTVVDGRNGKILGNIEGMPGGTHGIAIDASTGQGYTDDGGKGDAVAFNLGNLKVTKTIKAEEDADGMTFDPASGNVFVVDGDPGHLTVIDPRTNTVAATVNVGAKLEYIVADGDGKVYVNGEEKKEIVRVDSRTNLVDAHWPMPGCESPHGLAIDTVRHRLFSSCANGVMAVVSTDSGALVATLSIGGGTDAAAFDPKRQLIYSSNGRDGTITVIRQNDPQNYAVVATVKTAVTGRTMSIDPISGRLYVAAAEVDAKAAAVLPAPRRPPIVPGSLRLMFIDPSP